METGRLNYPGMDGTLMFRKRKRRLYWDIPLIESSPLRQLDPRIKLLLSLTTSLATVLFLKELVFAWLGYIIILAASRVLFPALRQIWRLKWLLLGLFVLDWILVDLELALLVTLRIGMLTSTFILLFATTTISEFKAALEWLGLPGRYAFSISLAFLSLGLLEREWQAVQEAQIVRSAWSPPENWRQIIPATRGLVSLTIPAIVMTTKRAWDMTEAAYSRGFDSPHRKPVHRLKLSLADWLAFIACIAASAGVLTWRVMFAVIR